jgi:hypothetical protein
MIYAKQQQKRNEKLEVTKGTINHVELFFRVCVWRSCDDNFNVIIISSRSRLRVAEAEAQGKTNDVKMSEKFLQTLA